MLRLAKPFVSLFFFSSYGDHRYLHSFPTRRSSDLDRTIANGRYGSRYRNPQHSSGNAYRCRSEEHTSELQSHSDLVCRLLLEKKNMHRLDLLLAKLVVAESCSAGATTPSCHSSTTR